MACFVSRFKKNASLHVPALLISCTTHRKFPGLISGPTIDWFLPWPEEALVAVAHGLVADFPMDCPADIKGCLMTHMGVVHRMVTEVKPRRICTLSQVLLWAGPADDAKCEDVIC